MGINTKLAAYEIGKHYTVHLYPPTSVWWLNLLVQVLNDAGLQIKTDSDLARALTLTRAAISNYRKGQSLSVNVAMKVADLLEINPLQVISSVMYEQSKNELDHAMWLLAWREARLWRKIDGDNPLTNLEEKTRNAFSNFIEVRKEIKEEKRKLTPEDQDLLNKMSTRISAPTPPLATASDPQEPYELKEAKQRRRKRTDPD